MTKDGRHARAVVVLFSRDLRARDHPALRAAAVSVSASRPRSSWTTGCAGRGSGRRIASASSSTRSPTSIGR